MTKWTLSDGKVLVLSRKQEKMFRKIEKKSYKRMHGGAPKEVRPLLDEERIFITKEDRELGEPYWYEYGFLRGTNWTDEEVEEIIDDMVYRVHSMYDCTGEPTTVWLTWHRNPSGLISFVHHVTIDI